MEQDTLLCTGPALAVLEQSHRMNGCLTASERGIGRRAARGAELSPWLLLYMLGPAWRRSRRLSQCWPSRKLLAAASLRVAELRGRIPTLEALELGSMPLSRWRGRRQEWGVGPCCLMYAMWSLAALHMPLPANGQLHERNS